MKTLFLLLASIISFVHISAQIPGIQEQPQWAMPFFFEDANGERDTIWIGYDPSAEHGIGGYDSAYNEFQKIDTSKFVVILNKGAYSPNMTLPVDSAYKNDIQSNEFIYVMVDFSKGKMPVTIKWGNSKFYSDSLPGTFPNISPRPRARADMYCNNGEPPYFYCHISSLHPPIILSDYYVPEFQYTQVYADSFYFDGSGNMPAEQAINMTLQIVPHNDPYLGVNIQESNLDFSLYPNPADNLTAVSAKQPRPYTIRVYEVGGNLVRQYHNRFDKKTTMDLSDLASGIYVVTIETQKGIQHHKLMVK